MTPEQAPPFAATTLTDDGTWPLAAARTAWPDRRQSAATVAVNVDGVSVDEARSPHGNLGGRFSHGRFAINAGLRNLLDAVESIGVPVTFFVSARDAALAPRLVRQLHECGHEVAGRGVSHEDYGDLTHARAAALVARARQALEDVTGVPPVGWSTPSPHMSTGTLSALSASGLSYDSSNFDSDVPYVFDVAGRRLVEIPQAVSLGDAIYYERLVHPHRVLDAWRDELSAIHAAGLLFSLRVHARGDIGSARGLRLRILVELLKEIVGERGMWVGSHAALAEWEYAKSSPVVVTVRSADVVEKISE